MRVPTGFNIPAASSRGLAKCRDVLRAYVVIDGGPKPDRRDLYIHEPCGCQIRPDLIARALRETQRVSGAHPRGLTVCDRVVFGDRHVTDAVSTGAQHAGEVFEDRWPLLLQNDAPQDYVLATGHAMTVREFCQAAFAGSASTGSGVAYDPRTSDPPGSTRSSATRARRSATSAGRRRRTARRSCTSWSTPTYSPRGRARGAGRADRPLRVGGGGASGPHPRAARPHDRAIGGRGHGDSAEVPRCRGAEVPRCRGAEVPRCRGAEVPRCRGAEVPRCRGATMGR